MLRDRLWFVCVVAVLAFTLPTANAADATWKAGTSRAVITPEVPLWMAGYGNRNRPAEGTLHDLWIKALALEAEDGRRAVVISTDTLGIPQSIYDNTCAALEKKLGLDRSQIMLNSSHTHCGPVLRGALHDIYPLDDEQLQRIDAYSTKLESQLVQIVEEAFSKLVPAKVSVGQGSTNFAVNRRNNVESEVPRLTREDNLKGPVDHSVPVLAVTTMDDQLLAVVFGYACHNTTLSFYKWCGDYAGFAQMALERSHPECVAMFHIGCGADQNPIPRRTVQLSERYGTMLASAVEETLRSGKMSQLPPKLQTEFQFVELNLGDAPTRTELQKLSTAGSSYINRWAKRLLGEMEAGKKFRRTYPYPVQVWKLGGRQLWITMGGEVVVDYALGFKKAFGSETWVTGYCNDVMAYIPSLRVLEEDVPPRASSRWGYEGNTSMMVYGMPANRWATDVEELISNAITEMVAKVNQ